LTSHESYCASYAQQDRAVSLSPQSAIVSKSFWNEKTDEEADNPFATERKNTLHDVLPVIDSLEIVKFMLRIEEIIDIEIPPKVIQRGGI